MPTDSLYNQEPGIPSDSQEEGLDKPRIFSEAEAKDWLRFNLGATFNNDILGIDNFSPAIEEESTKEFIRLMDEFMGESLGGVFGLDKSKKMAEEYMNELVKTSHLTDEQTLLVHKVIDAIKNFDGKI